jgi:hypothetical protein
MKFKQFIITNIVLIGLFSCNTSKVVSINDTIMVTEATTTPTKINNSEGAILNFTVISKKEISLDSVYYWETKKPLIIIKTSGDTIWAKSEIRKPVFAKENVETSQNPSIIRPPDTTCVLIYHLNEKPLKIDIPALKVVI